MDDFVLPVPASMIWDLLRDFPGGYYRPPPWAECLRRGRGVIGELHFKEDVQADDFKQVPIAQSLRVVMMRQGEGYIMRWGDSSETMERALGGIYHDDLLRKGDQFKEVRFGRMTIPSAGCLEIH